MMSSSPDETTFDFCNEFDKPNEEGGARDHEAIWQKDHTASRNTGSQFPPGAENTTAGCSDWQQLKNKNDILLQREKLVKRKEQEQIAKEHKLTRITEKIKQDKEDIQKQLTSQLDKEKGLLEDIQSLKNQCLALQNRIHELNKQQEQSNNVQTELGCKLQQAEGTILALEKDKKILDEEKKLLLLRDKEEIQKHEKEKEGLLEDIQSWKNQCQAYQRRIHELEKQQEQSNNVQTEQEDKLQQAEEAIYALTKDKSSLEEEKKRLSLREQLTRQHESDKRQLQEIQSQCRAYQKRIQELLKQQEQSNNVQTELEGKLHQAEGMFLALKKDKRSLDKEKERLLHRLSQLAGAKLTLDNPNIADLSDTKRPTKLAEEFAELYDNEWTDAFEDVDLLNEQTKLTFMLKLLQRTNEICREVSYDHMNGIKKRLCTLMVRSKAQSERSSTMQPEKKETEEMIKAKRSRRNSQPENTEPRCPSMEREVICDFNVLQPDQKKSIIELRKCIEINLSKDLEEVVTDVIAKENDFDKETHAAVFKYVTKCVNICWSMCRVEPPVYISFTEVQGDFSLDTNVYKSYTKSGKFIDYIVWPAVYLHENGPLLCKGVAQGRT